MSSFELDQGLQSIDLERFRLATDRVLQRISDEMTKAVLENPDDPQPTDEVQAIAESALTRYKALVETAESMDSILPPTTEGIRYMQQGFVLAIIALKEYVEMESFDAIGKQD